MTLLVCSFQAYSEMGYIVKDMHLFETHLGVEAGDRSIFYNGKKKKKKRFMFVFFYGMQSAYVFGFSYSR